MESELFRPIKDYEGLYEISNIGRIRSLSRLVNGNRGTYFTPGRIRKTEVLKHGYEQVKLCKGGKKTSYLVHRLVGAAFVPNPHLLPQINHKDGDKLNNLSSNLEWCSPQENSNHKWDNLIDRKDFARKLKQSGREKKIGDSHRGGKSVNAKKVLDTSTGKIYDCVKDAAKDKEHPYSSLKQWLRGEFKNKSTLQYVA